MHKNLSQMATFAQVIHSGSITKAAAELNMTKSSVSDHILKLENKLGTVLLDRSRRKHELTGDGRYFFKYCNEILEGARRTQQAMEAKQTAPKGEIKVAMPSFLCQKVLTPALNRFAKEHQEVCVHLMLAGQQMEVAEMGCDIQFTIRNSQGFSQHCQLVKRTEMWLCASPDYLLDKPSISHPEQLRDFNIIASGRRSQSDDFNFPSYPNVELDSSGNMRAGDISALYELIVNSVGIGLLPAFLVKDELKQGRLVHLLPNYRLPPQYLCAVFNSERRIAHIEQMLVDYVITQCS